MYMWKAREVGSENTFWKQLLGNSISYCFYLVDNSKLLSVSCVKPFSWCILLGGGGGVTVEVRV